MCVICSCIRTKFVYISIERFIVSLCKSMSTAMCNHFLRIYLDTPIIAASRAKPVSSAYLLLYMDMFTEEITRTLTVFLPKIQLQKKRGMVFDEIRSTAAICLCFSLTIRGLFRKLYNLVSFDVTIKRCLYNTEEKH